ncbi:MFS transporter [Haloparvum sedimenti]|uniref:MFS transporter n=1 Tax=Haloparvum sedimenti TaxID=1678448 RepID=UPI00071E7521|nr:MFS transporter [Haloparvum sedimenti]
MSRAKLFGSLCGLVFLVNFARVIFAPLVGEFIDEFAIREGTAGLVVTLAWVGSAAPRFPTGWLLTKVPRHHVVLASGAMLSLGAVFLGFTDGVAWLMVGAFAVGTASGVYFVSANPFISELFPDRVGRVMGIHGMASQVAAVVVAPVATVALWYDWRYAFFGLGVLAALLTALTYVLARRADLPDVDVAATGFLAAARSEWHIIVAGVALMGITSFVWQGLFNFYELYMVAKGLPQATARNLLTVIFAAGVPAFFISGSLVDRFPRVQFLLAVIASFVCSVFLIVAASGLWPLVAATTLAGFTIHAMFPAADAYILDTLPDTTRATAYAVFSGGMMLTQALGSSAVGALVERGIAYDTVFTVFAAGLAVLVVVFAGLDRAGRIPG